jgi:hypothetical protein
VRKPNLKTIQSILSKPIRPLLGIGAAVLIALGFLAAVIPFGIMILCGVEVNAD